MQGLRIVAALSVVLAAAAGVAGVLTRPSTAAPVVLDERPLRAQAFVDSVGFNVHLSYASTAYGDTARLIPLVQNLHVRHLRDGMTPDRPAVCATARAFAKRDVHFTYITQADVDPAAVRAWAACAGPAIEAFEGLNEYDISHPPAEQHWAATVRAAQRALYSAVKGTPATARLPVIAPSLTTAAAFRDVGNLSNAIDYGNVHDYFSDHEPETPGWGVGGYGSIAYNVQTARALDPDKPVEATETGYGTDDSGHAVDDVAQATYLPRLFLQQFADGIPRTFGYELIDEGGAPFAHYGIVKADFTPKPAYPAVASLLAALNDAPSHAAVQRLEYTLRGGGGLLRHVLFEKADGEYVLALWLATASYDTTTRTVHEVAPQRVTIGVDEPLRSAAVETYGSDWRLHRAPLPVTAAPTVAVTDRVALVDLVPLR